MITSKIIQNFNFGKLKYSWDKIINDSLNELGEDTSMTMINRIANGLKPKLAKTTLKKDKKFPRLSNKPLMRTGNLLESLKYNENTRSIEMANYGKAHNDGFMNPNTRNFAFTPARPFMDLGVSDSTKLIKKEIIKKIRKAIKI